MKFILSTTFIFCVTLIHAQNVGIGTTTPTEKLHVAGNIKTDTVKPNAIKLTTNAGAGKILTSDATGNASWQNGLTAGNVGFGPWGDCSVNNISEYNPVVDVTGAAGDHFGISSALSGNFAIVGSYLDDVGVNADQGSASIFQFNGANWVLMQKITDATGAAGDNFGLSVSISGNYAIVGSYQSDVVTSMGTNVDQGSASIYRLVGNSWVLMQKITDATGSAFDNFGVSVSISGNYAIVGAYLDDVVIPGMGSNVNQGSASIYQFNGTMWVLMNKITDNSGALNDYFGFNISISGNYAIVGAPGDDVGSVTDQGSAIIFQFNGSNWVQIQKITDVGASPNANLGYSVSIAGNYVIIGAFNDGFGAPSTPFGSAIIYQFNGSSWILMQKIANTNKAIGDYFGCSVSISGNYAIVGARGTSRANFNQEGSATIYLRLGTGWKKLQYITDPEGNAGDFLGASCGVDGITQRFIIGADGYGNLSGNVLFGKIN